jgi:hypothetical protein
VEGIADMLPDSLLIVIMLVLAIGFKELNSSHNNSKELLSKNLIITNHQTSLKSLNSQHSAHTIRILSQARATTLKTG